MMTKRRSDTEEKPRSLSEGMRGFTNLPSPPTISPLADLLPTTLNTVHFKPNATLRLAQKGQILFAGIVSILGRFKIYNRAFDRLMIKSHRFSRMSEFVPGCC